ncbi:MAG: type IX secretion system outer membrane channel protein PorV [Bacteroidota bacterium]
MVLKRINKAVLLVLFGMAGAMLFIPSPLFAQGEAAVPFLQIAPNARADGMGEGGIGLADDASAAHWNPAGLAFQRGQEVSLTHSNWLPQFQQADLFYDYLAYRNYMPEWGGTISGSITYLNLGEFTVTDKDPTPLATFKGYEFAVTGGYSAELSPSLGLGLNIRYIRSVLAPFDVQNQGREGIGSTASFDISTLWKARPDLNIGVNLSNIGPKITYIDAAQADPIPTNLGLGFAYSPVVSQYNNITLIADFNRLLVRRYPEIADSTFNPATDKYVVNVIQQPSVDGLPKALITAWGDRALQKITISGGVEYWYGYPKLIALRFGYFYENPNTGNRKFMTFGAGIRYDVYGFDFSYLSAIEENSPLAETLRFTLLISWGEVTPE